MKTNTPRTDAAQFIQHDMTAVVNADFARTLEAELATAKAIIASIEEDGTEEHNAAVRLRQELATERARVDQLILTHPLYDSRDQLDAAMKEETK